MELARGRRRGVGLNNVEQRLRSYCGPSAWLRAQTAPGQGACVELCFPLTSDGSQVALIDYAASERMSA